MLPRRSNRSLINGVPSAFRATSGRCKCAKFGSSLTRAFFVTQHNYCHVRAQRLPVASALRWIRAICGFVKGLER